MRCANCSAELVGEYCHVCGQHVSDNTDLAITPMLRQFWHELVRLDFKTLHTLKTLFVPGKLTREFLDGRRSRYVSPLKLYFLSAAIFFFAAPAIGFSLLDMIASDSSPQMKEIVAARARERSMDMALFAERFDLRVQTVFTLSYGVSLIAAALMLRALFRRYTLGAHLVFGLHYISFLCFGAIIVSVLQKITGLNAAVASIALTYSVIAPYLFLATRRVYGQSRLRTLAKVVALCAGTFLVDSAVNAAALFVTLWLV